MDRKEETKDLRSDGSVESLNTPGRISRRGPGMSLVPLWERACDRVLCWIHRAGGEGSPFSGAPSAGSAPWSRSRLGAAAIYHGPGWGEARWAEVREARTHRACAAHAALPRPPAQARRGARAERGSPPRCAVPAHARRRRRRPRGAAGCSADRRTRGGARRRGGRRRWGLGGAGAVVSRGLPGPGAAVPPPPEEQEREVQSGSAGGRRARGCARGAALAEATRAGSGSAGPGEQRARRGAVRADPPGPGVRWRGEGGDAARRGAVEVWQRRRVSPAADRGAGVQRLPLGGHGRGRGRGALAGHPLGPVTHFAPVTTPGRVGSAARLAPRPSTGHGGRRTPRHPPGRAGPRRAGPSRAAGGTSPRGRRCPGRLVPRAQGGRARPAVPRAGEVSAAALRARVFTRREGGGRCPLGPGPSPPRDSSPLCGASGSGGGGSVPRALPAAGGLELRGCVCTCRLF